MSESQGFVLIVMAFIGAFGGVLAPIAFDSGSKLFRYLVIGWVVVWTFPPLALLWIKGVFG